MVYEDNVHSYSYRDIMVSTIVLLERVIDLHVFLQVSFEYARFVKYKCNKIQKIWIVSGLYLTLEK